MELGAKEGRAANAGADEGTEETPGVAKLELGADEGVGAKDEGGAVEDCMEARKGE